MGVSVGGGISVGGMGILVGLGNTILVGVRDGTRVEVAENLPSRVRVGGSGVQVTKCLVGVTEAMTVGEGGLCECRSGRWDVFGDLHRGQSHRSIDGIGKGKSTTSCAGNQRLQIYWDLPGLLPKQCRSG